MHLKPVLFFQTYYYLGYQTLKAVILAQVLLEVELLFVRLNEKCVDEKITLIGLDHLSSEDIDYNDFEKLSIAIANRPEAFTIYKTSKPYNPNRSTEIFKMISSGAVATDSKLFELLEKLC